MSKKLYLYDRVDIVSSAWHKDGGLIIITAGDPQEAYDREVFAPLVDESWSGVKADDQHALPEPTRVIDLHESEADAVYVFPDSGCC